MLVVARPGLVLSTLNFKLESAAAARVRHFKFNFKFKSQWLKLKLLPVPVALPDLQLASASASEVQAFQLPPSRLAGKDTGTKESHQ